MDISNQICTKRAKLVAKGTQALVHKKTTTTSYKLESEIFINTLKGFNFDDRELAQEKVLKLNKTLYSLRESPSTHTLT